MPLLVPPQLELALVRPLPPPALVRGRLRVRVRVRAYPNPTPNSTFFFLAPCTPRLYGWLLSKGMGAVDSGVPLPSDARLAARLRERGRSRALGLGLGCSG